MNMATRRVLGLRDVILFNIVAVVAPPFIALAVATARASALVVWALAIAAFLVPLAFAVRSLSSALPREGGLYAWTTKAFGPSHGFLAGWCYWAANIPFYPAATVHVATYAYYALHRTYVDMEGHHLYVVVTSLLLLGAAGGINIIGLRYARWLQNLGGIAIWLPMVILFVVGCWALWHRGSATPMSFEAFWPPFGQLSGLVKAFAYLCFAFAGFELAPTMAGEVIEPEKTLPRAVVPSSLLIAACYILGTLALLWILQPQSTDIIAVVVEIVATVGLPWLGPPIALLMTVGLLGGIGAWLVGPTRLLLAGGAVRYLPAAFSWLHPRWQTPYIAILFQVGMAMVFVVADNLGATLKSAYLIFLNATLIVYFVPFLYLFASALRLRDEVARTPGALPLPGGRIGSWIVNAVGFLTTLVAITLALIPDGGQSVLDYVGKVWVGSILLIALGPACQLLARRGRNAR